ncbi:hypothetical protein BDV36DRAFT_259803 [Aspergillus pseudocaelatus]|uniref:Uncharacterized protein n=1 Tax=Aspergillus pseudocaelatus TaxID=1825620 RepID=A0ABQ6WK20_9EURO|nr:hypothetical protein BDV36DRAFT_259803 [Aspergillus pseudocaelatus]
MSFRDAPHQQPLLLFSHISPSGFPRESLQPFGGFSYMSIDILFCFLTYSVYFVIDLLVR